MVLNKKVMQSLCLQHNPKNSGTYRAFGPARRCLRSQVTGHHVVFIGWIALGQIHTNTLPVWMNLMLFNKNNETSKQVAHISRKKLIPS